MHSLIRERAAELWRGLQRRSGSWLRPRRLSATCCAEGVQLQEAQRTFNPRLAAGVIKSELPKLAGHATAWQWLRARRCWTMRRQLCLASATALRIGANTKQLSWCAGARVTYCQSTAGPEDPATLASMNNLAAALDDMGQHKEAARQHRQTLQLRQKVLGPEHPPHAGQHGQPGDRIE